MLSLPGGEAWDRGENSKILESAKALLAADIPVAAICGATAGLARASILDDILTWWTDKTQELKL